MSRIAAIVLLVLLLVGVSPATAQETFTYALDGADGEVTLRRDGSSLVLAGRLNGQDLTLRGTRDGTAWRFVLPGTPGLAGALEGARGAPRVLLLRRGAGDVLEGRIESQNQAPVTFRGARRQPAPPAECKPTRDRWYSRHGVAVWEVGRALWDFYKPGSRRLEELRGEVTMAQTRALRARLDRVPAPWSPDTIYAEARAMTRTTREALELSFALTVDQLDMPLAPLPGIDPGETIFDKYEHFFASAVLAHRSNATGSFTVGWLKEVMDEVSSGTYSEADLMADALGAEFGQRLQCAE